ncbi:acid protease, partial [Laetiporus sulphureus 93-53]
MNALFLIVIGSLCGLANALTIPLSAREPHFDARSRHLPMRLVGMQSISQTSNDDVINFYDTVYATNMTIGGQDLLIQLDTGSSDLWVSLPSGQFEFTNVTDITAQETYGIGAVTGTIVFANASLGDHFVYNQAFINATNATDFGTIFGDNVRGILGLSFDAGSTVDVDVVEAFGANSTAGVSFLVNLFLQNPNMSHFFTTQLGRTD